MAATHTGLQQPSLRLAIPLCPIFCPQHLSSNTRLSSSFGASSHLPQNNFRSSSLNQQQQTIVNTNTLSEHRCLNRNISSPPMITDQFEMNSYSTNDSPMICNNGIEHRSKSIGSFASALVNAKSNQYDAHNNNYHNSAQQQQPTTILPSTDSTTKLEDSRVPVNGESTPIFSSIPRTNGIESQQMNQVSQDRRDFSIEPKCPNMERNKLQEYTISTDPWIDDSLSMFSSISSSMSSLPSPPSPASPPPHRPQSLPQAADIPVCGDPDLVSSSLPEPASFTTFCTNSCGESARKRLKDRDGFIRRAACICLNKTETEVLLVSSKSSKEVWIVPGGGLEEGEEDPEAAIREAHEEAGVRGKILAYLGLFQDEANNGSKKHRTAVFVMRVTQLEDVYPENTAIGRERKWMPIDEASAHLSRHRPRQGVYLRLLKLNRLNSNDGKTLNLYEPCDKQTIVMQDVVMQRAVEESKKMKQDTETEGDGEDQPAAEDSVSEQQSQETEHQKDDECFLQNQSNTATRVIFGAIVSVENRETDYNRSSNLTDHREHEEAKNSKLKLRMDSSNVFSVEEPMLPNLHSMNLVEQTNV